MPLRLATLPILPSFRWRRWSFNLAGSDFCFDGGTFFRWWRTWDWMIPRIWIFLKWSEEKVEAKLATKKQTHHDFIILFLILRQKQLKRTCFLCMIFFSLAIWRSKARWIPGFKHQPNRLVEATHQRSLIFEAKLNCWWLRSGTTTVWDGKNPINNGRNGETIYQPQLVDFSHQGP